MRADSSSLTPELGPLRHTPAPVPWIRLLKLRSCTTTLLFLLAQVGWMAQSAESFAVFRSIDSGRSWSRSDSGLPVQSRVNAFTTSGQTVFAGTDSGIYRSDDQAQTWRPVATTATSPIRVLSLASLVSHVFAGTARHGLWLSTDAGRTWKQERALPSGKIRCLLARDRRVYAGTDADGVFVSHDRGASWTSLEQGWPVRAQVFDLAEVRGQLFAGLYRLGLYTWNETNSQWTKVGLVTPLALASAGETLIAGHNPGGIVWSNDLGASWTQGVAHPAEPLAAIEIDGVEPLTSTAPVWALASNDHIALAGASSGMFTSGDRGRTWARARTGLPAKAAGISFLLTPTLFLLGTSSD